MAYLPENKFEEAEVGPMLCFKDFFFLVLLLLNVCTVSIGSLAFSFITLGQCHAKVSAIKAISQISAHGICHKFLRDTGTCSYLMNY